MHWTAAWSGTWVSVEAMAADAANAHTVATAQTQSTALGEPLLISAYIIAAAILGWVVLIEGHG